MKKPKYSEAQILTALLRVEEGTPLALLCWEMGITKTTFLGWRETYAKTLQKAIANRETAILMARLTELEIVPVPPPKERMHHGLKRKPESESGRE